MDRVIASLVIGAIFLVLALSYFMKVHDYMLIVVIILGTAWWKVNYGHDHDFAAKWILLEFWTMCLFWTLAKQRRRMWRDAAFWGILMTLLLVHLAGSWLALRKVETVKPGGLIVLLFIEMVLIWIALDWALGRIGKRRGRGSKAAA